MRRHCRIYFFKLLFQTFLILSILPRYSLHVQNYRRRLSGFSDVFRIIMKKFHESSKSEIKGWWQPISNIILLVKTSQHRFYIGHRNVWYFIVNFDNIYLLNCVWRMNNVLIIYYSRRLYYIAHSSPKAELSK